MSKQTDIEAARRYLAAIGAKGGKTTGATKKRGDADYYRRIREKKVTTQAASVAGDTQAACDNVK